MCLTLSIPSQPRIFQLFSPNFLSHLVHLVLPVFLVLGVMSTTGAWSTHQQPPLKKKCHFLRQRPAMSTVQVPGNYSTETLPIPIFSLCFQWYHFISQQRLDVLLVAKTQVSMSLFSLLKRKRNSYLYIQIQIYRSRSISRDISLAYFLLYK